MLRDTTDRPLSTIKVIRAGGSAAFPGMVSSSQSDRPDRNLLKKKPPNLSGAHGVPAWGTGMGAVTGPCASALLRRLRSSSRISPMICAQCRNSLCECQRSASEWFIRGLV
jgi:hypothetical protein